MNRQLKRISSLVGAAVLGALSLLAPAHAEDQPDQRSGLWHAYNEENSSTLFFLVYNGVQSKLYDADWNRTTTTFQVEDGTLTFAVPGGRPQKVEARFEEGKLKGVLEMRHVQFTARYEFQAIHVSDDPDWEPWAFLKEAEASVIVSWMKTLEKAPLDDFSSFQAYWREEVEPRYYSLLTHALYGSETGIFFTHLRQEAIKTVFADLKERGEQIKQLADTFKELVKQSADDLRQLYPFLEIPGQVVPILGRQPFDFQIRILSPIGTPRFLLFFDLNWMAEELERQQVRYQIAQGLVAFDHVIHRPHPPFFRNEFVVRGIAAYLASRLDYSDSASAYLFQPEGLSQEKRLEAFKRFGAEFGRAFDKRPNEVSLSEFFSGEHRASSYLFGYGFAAQMANRFSERELVRLFDYGRVTDELRAYMRLLKEPPDPSKPESRETTKAAEQPQTNDPPQSEG
ncbi:MAG TPA: hypothetical protein VLU25_13515 [Acidobacteriota bacterium]|nr:hypothetical protein [Acidobacteriota bacterium]